MTINEFQNIFQTNFKDIYIIWKKDYLEDMEDLKWNGNFWTIKFTKRNKKVIIPTDLKQTRINVANLVKLLNLKVSLTKRRTQQTYQDKNSKFNIRLEFISDVGNDYGCVFALRFNTTDKLYEIYDPKLNLIIKNIIEQKHNIIIGGATGSGKTSLQKAIIKNINDVESIFLLEDTQDTSLKYLYPNKDITAVNLRDNPKYYEQDLIHGFKSAKRFNPEWIILSEATDQLLKKSLVETMMSAHKTITTIHNNDINSTILDLANAITTANDNTKSVALKVARNIGYFISCKYIVAKEGYYIRYIEHISCVEFEQDMYKEIKLYEAKLEKNCKLITQSDVFNYENNRWINEKEK